MLTIESRRRPSQPYSRSHSDAAVPRLPAAATMGLPRETPDAIMPPRLRTSGKAILALFLGLLSVACVVLAVPVGSDFLVLGVLGFWLTALVLDILTRVEIHRAPGEVQDRALADMGIGLASAGILLGACLVPEVLMIRDVATRIRGGNTMHRIVGAMTAYADAHGGRLPPAVLRDKDSRPLLSWRVLLLPELGEGDLYRDFHLDEPWDSPHNVALLSRRPQVYAPPPDLPAAERAGPSGTFYQVFTGPGTAFERAEGLRLPQDFPDGPSDTILVIEAGEPVPWTRPEDLAYDPHGPLPALGGVFTGEGGHTLVGRNRRRLCHVGLADGSVRYFDLRLLSEATLRDAITRNDGRRLGPDW
jgi:hypothetical protein